MTGWRIAFGLGLGMFVVIPLLMPFSGLLDAATWRWTAEDVERLSQLGINTFLLAAGTLALSLPLGIILAVLLCRTHFFARQSLHFLLALALFVPLPVIVSSWQGLLGADGLGTWLGTSDRPWITGLGPAIWIHALSAIPWVAFIVGLGLRWVEPELENEASQSVGAWRVLLLVSLPRARASVLAAALFVVLQTAGETNVTDIMQVPTLADEVRTQFVRYDRAALARTLLLSLPALLVIWGSVLAVLTYLEKRLPPPAPLFRGQQPLELGLTGFRFLVAFLLLILLIVPLVSLAWKLGLTGHPRHWSSEVARHFLHAETRVLGKELGATLGTSLATGFIVAGVALVGCWLARGHTWFRWLLFSVLIGAWVLPGPVIGIGLHDLILHLPEGPWKTLVYHGPSPLPMMWVQTIRALPIAAVFLWPVVRQIPQEFFEEARLGGAGAVSELLHVVAPLTWRATLVTGLAATALCLGEVAASARVETPGWESFTKLLLDRMHYGVDNTLAALSVLLLASLFVLGLLAVGVGKLLQRQS